MSGIETNHSMRKGNKCRCLGYAAMAFRRAPIPVKWSSTERGFRSQRGQRTKTAAEGRAIWRTHAGPLTLPGTPEPSDPVHHAKEVKRSWKNLRKLANVSCRLHDRGHTFATSLAERDVPESTMLALMGHMSRAMLERYSHVRMAAKVQAYQGSL